MMVLNNFIPCRERQILSIDIWKIVDQAFEVQPFVFIPVRRVYVGHRSEMFKMTRRFYFLGGLFLLFPFDEER